MVLRQIESADLTVTASNGGGQTLRGAPFKLYATLTNIGPNSAQFPGIGFAFNAAISDIQVVSNDASFSCDAPVVTNGSTTVACASPTPLSYGKTGIFSATGSSNSVAFISLAASATSETGDPDPSNNSAYTNVVFRVDADLAAAISGPRAITSRTPSAQYQIKYQTMARFFNQKRNLPLNSMCLFHLSPWQLLQVGTATLSKSVPAGLSGFAPQPARSQTERPQMSF